MAKGVHGRARAVQDRRGYPMAVFANDLIGINVNHFGVYEGRELEVLFDFLGPLQGAFTEGLALDVGANIGNHALWFSRRFRRVSAFEPHPAALELLRFNARSAPNLTVYPHGLSDRSGKAPLLEDPINLGGSTMLVQGDPLRPALDVPVERLDDLALDLTGLCFLKVDVEGVEAAVLEGARDTLQAHQPVVVLEQHAWEFQGGSTSSIELLRDLGYRFCWHESALDASPRVLKPLRHLWALVAGETHRMRSAEEVPARHHSMLVAVPPRFAAALGLDQSPF